MWEEREFLIFAKTYPEYSSTYVETVCTAAILKDTGKLLRLYPIPFRYLTGEHQFRKYQWVTARIKKNPKDDRPESHWIKPDSINLGDAIGTQNGWEVRKQRLLSYPQNIYGSLEALHDQQQKDGTSLGIIKPKRIIGFQVQSKTQSEISEVTQKKVQILAQRSFVVEKKDLELIPYRFLISFVCDYRQCKEHQISILDWEFGQLYRNVVGADGWQEKIKTKVEGICSKSNDVYFFLGNLAKRRNTFCILGIFYPPKAPAQQLRLFPSR